MLKKSIRVIGVLNQCNSINSLFRLQSTQVERKTNEKYLTFENIPGPSVLDFALGFAPTGKYFKLNIEQLTYKLREEYGDILKLPTLFGKNTKLLVFHPSDFETVYRSIGAGWPIRNGMESFTYFRKNNNFKTGGLVAEHGEQWAQLRHSVNPVMLMPKTVKLYIKPLDNIGREVIDIIRNIRDKSTNEVPDTFNELMCKWSLESISYVALNKRLGLFESSNTSADGTQMINLITDFFEQAVKLDVEPSLWRYFATPVFKKQMKTLAKLNEVIMKNILIAEEELKQLSESRNEKNMSVLEKLLKIDRDIAMIMALDMMAAGIDTTSSSAVFLLYELARNPEKQEILRKEIFEAFPNKNTSFNEENTKHLPYLRACIKEAHRIRPVALGNTRALGEDTILQGYLVPKGVDVSMINLHSLHDDKFYPRSKEFLPERWLKAPELSGCPSAKTAHPFTYLPFGHGSRACIGKRFAQLEIELLVARIVRNFKVEWNRPDMQTKTHILTVPNSSLNFTFIDLNN